MTIATKPPDVEAGETEILFDPRFAFLCVAFSHYKLVRDGHEPIDYAFGCVTRLFDHMFPPADECCDVCGLAPCGYPSFCDACRRADVRRRT